MQFHIPLLLGFLILLPLRTFADDLLVDPDPKGFAAGVIGSVLILEPEADEPKLLADSDPVFEGSRITAAENSFVEIDLLDGSNVKVDEMSQVDLSKVSADLESLNREIDLSMLYGTIRVSTQNGFSDKSIFKISTPVAVVGVRGTDFAVGYESDDETDVDVFEGEVGVQQEAGAESVGEGESAGAAKGRGITKSRMDEGRRERWDQFKEAMDVHGQEAAASGIREKIERIRAGDPNDPRLPGLENALENVSKNRDEAKTRLESRREKMKDRRQDRLDRMKEFSKKHGREKFDRKRRFRGGKLSPEERKSAGEKLRQRHSQTRQKAGDRFKNRREEIKERKPKNIENRRDNRKQNMKENRQERRGKRR